jgi:hypothetical protein
MVVFDLSLEIYISSLKNKPRSNSENIKNNGSSIKINESTLNSKERDSKKKKCC